MFERKRLYLFIDEGGNLDFSPSGTRFFTLSSIATERPFPWGARLAELKYDLIDRGLDIEFFHASEDSQAARDQVFAIIRQALGTIRIDSVVVEKSKTPLSFRNDDVFYPRVLGRLVHYAIHGLRRGIYSELVVFTDALPVERKRRAVEKAVKIALGDVLPSRMPYRIMHHSSKSSSELQVVDYCNWAIFRKWERNDPRSYDLIREAVKSEFLVYQQSVADGVRGGGILEIHSDGSGETR